MKKYIFAAAFSLALLASPAFAQAASLTQNQINAIISLLQSFGADQTTINNVQASLTGGTTTGGGTQPWCHTFNTDLTFGSSGDDVSALSQVLSASGIVTSAKTTFFDENTAADVVQFQAKYGIRQTGYVGPITRAKLNALYGCPPNFPPTPPPFPPLPPPQPSITVLSPNGGESYSIGQEVSVRWKTTGLPQNVDTLLDIEDDRILGWQARSFFGSAPVLNYATLVSSSGSENVYEYRFVVPQDFNSSLPSQYQNVYGGNHYKTGVIALVSGQAGTASQQTVEDHGDAPFSIVAAPNKLQLTIPSNGEKWQIGSVHTIQWTPYNPQSGVNVVPTVSAYLERQVNGSFVTVGKIQEDGKASIHWSGLIGDTPQQRKNADPGEYYIRIVNSQTGEWDRSDVPFTLVAQNTIKVDLKINGLDASSDAPFALPTGGGEVTLSWTSLNADICRTYFYGLADDVTDLPSSGQKKVFLKQNPYTWVYGISLSCSASIGDARDIVYIAGANANSHVTITSPNGGESINSASQYPITWTSSNDITNVAIALYKNDAFYRWIAPNSIQSTGSLNWNPSTTLSGTWIEDGEKVFKIYMIGYKSSGGTVEDKSDAPFSIVAAPPVSTPITLSSITPSSGPVGTSIRLDGCGSDSTSGFTLVYSGPKNGTAVIPVETLGAASGCGYMTIVVPTDFPAGAYTLSVKNNQTGAMSTNSKVFTVTAPDGGTGIINIKAMKDGMFWDSPVFTIDGTGVNGATFSTVFDPPQTITNPAGVITVTNIIPPAGVTLQNVNGSSLPYSQTLSSGGTISYTVNFMSTYTPITLSSITPSSGPVGTSIRLDGCGSDSTSGFTLVYSGPKSGTASIPVETLGAASGCGYMTFTVPTDFPAGAYTLSVRNNQTGAMSTNSKTFTVTAPAQTITISRTPGTSLASPFKVDDATVSSSVNTPSLFASNLTGTGYNQIGTNAPRTFTFTTFDLVNSGACNATTGICNMPGKWDAASFVCPAGMGAGTTQYMTEWYTIGNVTSNKLNWYFKCSGTVTSMGAYTNPGLASALGAFGGATNSTSQSTSGFSYVWNRDLQIGSLYPDDIAALQQALTREGVYAGEITGGFYNQTYTAVRAFQEKYGINQTGYVGLITRSKLNALY